MTKIKVNINKPDPPQQVIRKYKNYNSFLRTYQELHTPQGIAKMMYRDKVKLSMIVVMLVLLLLFILAELEEPQKEAPVEDAPTTGWVSSLAGEGFKPTSAPLDKKLSTKETTAPRATVAVRSQYFCHPVVYLSSGIAYKAMNRHQYAV